MPGNQPRVWFIGDADRLATVRIPPDSVLVPLDVFTQAALGPGGVPIPDLFLWESNAVADVLQDLELLVDSFGADQTSRRWLSYRGYSLSSALARPENAYLGFPKQRLAHKIATHVAPGGRAGAIGANPYQLEGLRAALGERLVAEADPLDRPQERPSWRERLRPFENAFRATEKSASAGRRATDVLYLGLEPHVVRQQDRILTTLASDLAIDVVVPLRTPWSWPKDVQFLPRSVRPLFAHLDARSLARLTSALLSNAPPRAAGLRPPPWMSVDACRRWIRREWWRASVFAEGLEAALRAYRPRLLIGTNLLSHAGKVATAVCDGMKVPALGLPSGADQMIPRYLTAADVGYATYVLAGKAVKDRLIAGGAAPDRLEVCGLPELDSFPSGSHTETRQELMRRHGLDPARPLVTFFSSPSLPNELLIFPKAAKLDALDSLLACRERLGIEVLVKLHPRETDGAISRHLQARGVSAPVGADPLPDVLEASDVVASLASAVTFTALLLGKPALLLHFNLLPLLTEVYRLTGAGLSPESPEAVPDALARALSGELQRDNRAFVDDWLAGGDGRAADRIVALARRLLS